MNGNGPKRPRAVLAALVAAAAVLCLALPAGASAAAEWTLTVNVTGEGSGEVECEIKEPDGEGEYYEYEENCEGVGKHANNTKISILPYPEVESSKFGGFENGTGNATVSSCTGKKAKCVVTLKEDSSVDVRFDYEEFALTINSKGGTGTGAVKCSTGGPFAPCAPKYPYESEVTLLAEAEAGSEFIGWSGVCEFFEEECELTIEEATTVTVIFDLEPTLTVTKNGAGTVQCEAEVDPETCKAKYPKGTELSLLATANPGSTFAGFSAGTGSAVSCSISPCSFTLEANSTLTATFNTVVIPKLTVTKSGSGSGTVTSTPSGINCGTGAGCEAEYDEGTEVTLSQSASAGSEFVKWTGACSGTGTCKVTMSAAKAVGAVFNAQSGGGSGGGSTGGRGGGTVAGTASAAALAQVKSGKAALKITCSGGACSGSLTLKAKVKQGKKTKNLVIGKASFSLASGASATLSVKLSGPAKSELAKGKTLKAKLSGSGIAASTVKLKPG